ncbi:hypothetical protein ABZY91_17245, partial [Kitasatospora sp. NPDC002965]
AAGRNDVAAVLGFLVALVAAVMAAQRWHEAQEYRSQAQAAGRAGRLLREAVEVSAGAVAARGFRPHARRSAPAREAGPRSAAGARSATPGTAGRDGARLMAAVVQQAIPVHASAVLADPAWPALRDRLVHAEESGDDPVQVLEAVAGQRELTSADSVAEVLTWRLDGWARTRAPVPSTSAKTPPTKATGGGTAPARGKGPVAGKKQPPDADRPKGPRRAR